MNFKILLLALFSLVFSSNAMENFKTPYKLFQVNKDTINESGISARMGSVTGKNGTLKDIEIGTTLTLNIEKFLVLENAEIGEKLIIKKGIVHLKNVKVKELIVEENAFVGIYKNCDIQGSCHTYLTRSSFINK